MKVHEDWKNTNVKWYKTVTSIRQGLTVGQILFSVFFSYLNNKTKHTLSKFPDGIKLEVVVDRPDAYAAKWRDLNKALEKRAKNLIKLNKGTY